MESKSRFSSSDRSDDEDEERDTLVVEPLPECVCTNKRTKEGPFLIEHLKANKQLGLNVMMDGEGQCVITQMNDMGSIVKDKRIRLVCSFKATQGRGGFGSARKRSLSSIFISIKKSTEFMSQGWHITCESNELSFFQSW